MGLVGVCLQSVVQDGDGFLWLASSGGNLQRYRNGEWRSFGPEDGLPRHDINALWEPLGFLADVDVRLIQGCGLIVPTVNVWSVADEGDVEIYARSNPDD